MQEEDILGESLYWFEEEALQTEALQTEAGLAHVLSLEEHEKFWIVDKLFKNQRPSSSGCYWLQLPHLSPSAQYSYVGKLGCSSLCSYSQ